MRGILVGLYPTDNPAVARSPIAPSLPLNAERCSVHRQAGPITQGVVLMMGSSCCPRYGCAHRQPPPVRVFPRKPKVRQVRAAFGRLGCPVNSPNVLSQSYLCVVAPSRERPTARQLPGAEIPFLHTKTPFLYARSLPWVPCTVRCGRRAVAWHGAARGVFARMSARWAPLANLFARPQKGVRMIFVFATDSRPLRQPDLFTRARTS